MTDWLVFATEPAAKSAIAQIDVQLRVPLTGRNAGTGKPEPGKAGTVTWAIAVQRLDGKWCFERCPEADPNRPFNVEQWDPSWFPQDEGG